ncbi:TIGR03089 family protein [Nocardiopsis sp. EMB25]|uniref:TIGR03089 family protein n=1 Tax=Nocardiopsis sp. EMB25 TaxID=2835867 RepID=UPI002285162A|nr:TIGR03089 family protein [Nocardiopsis sp. EMB25]MCY9785597.1 TIGR03089 family protein [Nocardiopsis sp. EMB25]
MSETPAQLWRDLVATAPAHPFVTSYDASGGRVELSPATLDNWVSKTANMMVDGFGTQPDDRVAVALPLHWQSIVWLLSSWSVGAVAVPVDGDAFPDGAQIAVADADRLGAALDSGAEEVVGASLHPLGLPLRDLPPMVLDYTTEARGHGDHFSPYVLDSGAPAYASGRAWTGAELVAAARERAERWALTGGDRVGIVIGPATPLSVLGDDASVLLAAVVAGTALVLLEGGPEDATDLRSRLKMEGATAVLDLADSGVAADGGFRALG